MIRPTYCRSRPGRLAEDCNCHKCLPVEPAKEKNDA